MNDELFHLDLVIFATTSGMKLERFGSTWLASLKIGKKTYQGWGMRPHIATHDLYLNIVNDPLK